MEYKRLNVSLPVDLITKIQSEFLARKGSAHGAIQDILARGAELALAEFTGDVLIERNGGNRYNSVNAEEVATKILQAIESLNDAISTLERSVKKAPIAPNAAENFDAGEQRLRNQTSEIEDALDELAPIAETLEGDISQSPKRKRFGNR